MRKTTLCVTPVGVRTTIAMHCGCKIFKMAAIVRYLELSLDRFAQFQKIIFVYIFSVKKNKSKLVFFWHQSEARTAATVWNWSGKTPGGHLGIFGVGMCRSGLQIGTPF